MKKLLLLLTAFTLIHPVGNEIPFDLLKKLLPESPIILEAGAQFGQDTDWMSKMWPGGTIHAFEPTPVSFAKLDAVAQKYNNVHTYPMAFAQENGTVELFVDGGDGGANSLLKPTDYFNTHHFHADLQHPITVEAITLDSWAQQNNVDHIDFMWLDMEGYELHALSAGEEILKTVQVIYIEVNLQNFWHDCATYEKTKTWLEARGFTEVWSDIAPNWHGNVLFVRK